MDDPTQVTCDWRSGRAFALYALGNAVRSTDRSAARCDWEESLVLYRALADRWDVTVTGRAGKRGDTATAAATLLKGLGAEGTTNHEGAKSRGAAVDSA